MSDFAQTGLITTLQRLNNTRLDALESELIEVSAERRIAVVLPCHASELERPALARIVSELASAAWLGEAVVAMNGPDESARERAEELFARMPQEVRILWHTDPTTDDTAAEPATGKGQNVAAAFKLLAEEGRCQVFAAQDCDVASFHRHDLARLCYAVAHPAMGFRFAKAYYARATDRLYGRVTRLALTPLLQALSRLAGHQPLLSFLLSFRYPLAGEIALTSELARALQIAPGWSLEIGMLCEVFRQVNPREICQVDGGRGYDHKHQPAGEDLARMTRQIARELIRQITAEFHPGPKFMRLLPATYDKEAEQAVARSAALARINQLPFDADGERELVRSFSQVLQELCETAA